LIETGGLCIYIDPYNVSGEKKADLILITHSHYDHCDPESISNLLKDDTIILCHESCVSRIDANVTALNPGDAVSVRGVRVEAHPAYNRDKPHHPLGSGIGFVVETEGKRVYHAGDTDLISEMGELRGIDVALIPVGGTYTMDCREACEAVRLIKPRIAVPMHYGDGAGSVGDAKRFKRELDAETKVEIMSEGGSTEI